VLDTYRAEGRGLAAAADSIKVITAALLRSPPV
jgi:hypothetical protein